jgi:DNA-binding response OmpR family regulator
VCVCVCVCVCHSIVTSFNIRHAHALATHTHACTVRAQGLELTADGKEWLVKPYSSDELTAHEDLAGARAAAEESNPSDTVRTQLDLVLHLLQSSFLSSSRTLHLMQSLCRLLLASLFALTLHIVS